MKQKLLVCILTYNESLHIQRAIENVRNWADKIIVLDSYSNDDTVEKARQLNVEVIARKFDNYKNQREYAIHYCKNKTEWMLFLDADEYLTDELKNEISTQINNKNINGFYLPRRFIFMNRWIKWGGYYPTYLLRLFRPEHASLQGIINEHVLVTGTIKKLKHDFVDHNLKTMSSWIEKHNTYATFEAKALINAKLNQNVPFSSNLLSQAGRKSWLRYKVWNRLPTVIFRPVAYFIYRYFFRLGFLDGKAGLIYHFLQGYWFWFLVDVKYTEMKNNSCAE